MPITPDDKDWTWVLERQCPECGFVADEVGRDEIGRRIRENAAAWPAVLAHADTAVRPDDHTWSPLEYGCHVRDVYRICAVRLERMLTGDDPTFANWDQDRTAVDDDYASQDPTRVAGEIADSATHIADRFDALTDDQWIRSGTRSDGAHFTVASFGRYVVHDPVHHLVDVGAAVPGIRRRRA